MSNVRTIPITEFAPAERMPIEIVRQQADIFESLPLTSQLLNSMLNYVLVLNQQRQIVFASKNLLALVPPENQHQILGMRPGEVLGCIHAAERDGGCGTTRFCSECGALKAILASIEGRSEIQECRMMRRVSGGMEALDLLVSATSFTQRGEKFSLFSILDIGHEKRRRALERVFFHDAINAVGGLEGMLYLMKGEAPFTMQEDLALADSVCHDLHTLVISQKDLTAAENHELKVCPEEVNLALLLSQVVDIFRHHDVARGRRLAFTSGPVSAALVKTDAGLLKRVVGNLLKNALEATPAGGQVTVGFAPGGADQVRISVHNPGCMPPAIQLQIFNRSFSTKGIGRGLGTYSVKLFAEQYLGGMAEFASTEAGGTTFVVTLPRVAP